MKDTIKQLFDLISNDALDPVLAKLKSIFSLTDSELLTDVIAQQARYKRLKSDRRKGILRYEEEQLQKQKILNAVIELVQELKNHPEDFEAYRKVDIGLDKETEKRNLKLSIDAKNTLYERLSHIKEKEIDFKALWIDDNPDNNVYETEVLNAIGVHIEIAKSSKEGLKKLKSGNYDLLLSDVDRDGNNREGLDFFLYLISMEIDIPTIFYTGYFDRSKGIPPYAFGMSFLPEELLHLVMDVIQRK